ncbi:MAG: RsmB/NOP family class I SAM-dependent RNA methyltransferase [Candidatus Thorarchaeota archaeon]|nr:RsmB/NOP family class I SAM-dependent RNA methyltransferase [Candidatus Thorarchaeota archaeon]
MVKKELRQRAKELANEHEYLPYMIERYISLWGEEDTLKFIEACEQPIRSSIRVNTLKTSAGILLHRLQDKRITLEEVPWLADGYHVDFNGASPGALLEHMLGFYYVQGVPSMTAVSVLDPRPGETVLDLAAAPGGKTTHIAQMMQNTGMVVAIEQDRQRMASLQSNIIRCGATNTIVLRRDAKKLDNLPFEPDRILLDAPCSGEGLIPLDPTRKTSKTMADIRFCATREDEMLEAAVNVLVEGGTMVYSTCSIAPEENEYIVDDILKRHPEMEIVEIPTDFGSPGYSEPYGIKLNESLKLARRFLPHLHGTEGFFICKMMKKEGPTK